MGNFNFEVYKSALARWSARQKFLVDKWSKALADVKQDINELYECSPSQERDWRIRAKELVMVDIQIFIDDLKAPADLFLVEADFVGDKKFLEVERCVLDL